MTEVQVIPANQSVEFGFRHALDHNFVVTED
jgi:hypothetical protein